MFETHKVCELIKLIDLIFYVLFCVAKVRTFLPRLFLKCFLVLRFCSKWGFLYVQKLAFMFKKSYNPCIYQGFIVLLL